MALGDDEGPMILISSYRGSSCSSVLFECPTEALLRPLFLFTNNITIRETATLIANAIAREPMEIMYAVSVAALLMMTVSVVSKLCML